jgi:hypothetical protein
VTPHIRIESEDFPIIHDNAIPIRIKVIVRDSVSFLQERINCSHVEIAELESTAGSDEVEAATMWIRVVRPKWGIINFLISPSRSCIAMRFDKIRALGVDDAEITKRTRKSIHQEIPTGCNHGRRACRNSTDPEAFTYMIQKEKKIRTNMTCE